MATRTALEFREGNDELVDVVVVPDTGGTLAGVTGLEFVLKLDPCRDDDDPSTVVLSTAAASIVITSQTAARVDATVTVPASALDGAWNRFFRLDALAGPLRRTAIYGPVTVVDL